MKLLLSVIGLFLLGALVIVGVLSYRTERVLRAENAQLRQRLDTESTYRKGFQKVGDFIKNAPQPATIIYRGCNEPKLSGQAYCPELVITNGSGQSMELNLN